MRCPAAEQRVAAAWPEQLRRGDPRFLRESQPGLAAGSRIEIIGNAGHFLHLERPETVARLALQWFGP
jgi:pimeloyl-ACP methyl ester carboxylesterase